MNLIQKCILLNKLSCRPGFLSLCTIDILGLICCMGLACVLWAAEQHPGLYPLDASSSCLSTFNSVNSSISTSAFTVIASIFFPKFYFEKLQSQQWLQYWCHEYPYTSQVDLPLDIFSIPWWIQLPLLQTTDVDI